MKKLLLPFFVLIYSLSTEHISAQIDLSLLKVKNQFSDLIEVDTTEPVRDPILRAELLANEEARKILELGRRMVLEDSTILPGTCWTYVNAIFKRAGFTKNRQIIHRGKKAGPYVDIDSIKPGDWLYYINHSYRGIDHSGIFVYWVNKAKKIGVTLSYTGRYKRKPGKYKEYDLKNVFFITRAGKKEEDIKLEASKL